MKLFLLQKPVEPSTSHRSFLSRPDSGLNSHFRAFQHPKRTIALKAGTGSEDYVPGLAGAFHLGFSGILGGFWSVCKLFFYIGVSFFESGFPFECEAVLNFIS